ncbi:MAG: alpha-L-rhamnosidase [Opitutaceae bacterium]|nr:alpha-L-rhamnosidase [Opitutaceae bacterium]
MMPSLHRLLPLVLCFTGILRAQPVVPLDLTVVTPVRVEMRGKVRLIDFGQVYYARLEFSLPPGLTNKIIVRLGEKLAPDGSIDRKPPGSVNFRSLELEPDPAGGTVRLVIPPKEFHLGAASVKMPPEIGEVTPFRYAEIEGAPTTLRTDLIRQIAVHAPFDDTAAAFSSSNDTLNAIWQLCRHTIKATTAFGVYIDGERERIPYEGDAYINQLSHYAFDLDPRLARATFAHLLRKPTWPTEWSLHMPLIAEADYEATGDATLARTHFEAIKAKLLMQKAGADGLLRASAIVDWPAAERDGYNEGVADPKEKKQVGPEVNTVANAFYYRALRATARLAAAIGRDDEASELGTRADTVYAAFNTTFFDASRGVYHDGKGSAHASLHANMFPLAFDLVPPERRAGVAAFVESRGMACSVYGAQYLLDALYLNGKSDYALGLMTNRGPRGWWHMIESGSTMTWEAWNAQAKPNLTWNHAWGAAPANIIARRVLGVRPLQPGYARILIAPQPGTLLWMKGKVPTPLGPVLVDWSADAETRLKIEVPVGATARVVLPGAASGPLRVSIDNQAHIITPVEGAWIIENLPSGTHLVSIKTQTLR